jgi:hypothetical protein
MYLLINRLYLHLQGFFFTFKGSKAFSIALLLVMSFILAFKLLFIRVYSLLALSLTLIILISYIKFKV